MSYQVLARKWRPRNFNEIVGQQHVVKSLSNALQHNRLHHAYLFTGTRGVGKTTIARILAKAVNCQQRDDYNPCGQCDVCQDLDAGRFLDLIEVDAASRTKVEDTRELLDNAQYAPHTGKYKVYLIDEVHMLSGHSFNALLKTLEEPPPHVKFLLATTDPQKIPITVLSRCLQFNLKRLLPVQMSDQMQFILEQENIVAEQAALKLIAVAADGSMRDALSLLDQAIVYGNGQVLNDAVMEMLGTIAQHPVNELLNALADQNAPAILACIQEMAEMSADYSDVVNQLLRVLHQLAVLKIVPTALDNDEQASLLKQLVVLFSAQDIQLYYQIALLGQRDLELAPDPRSGFEMLMLRMLTFRPVNDEFVQPEQGQLSGAEHSGTERTAIKPVKVEVSLDSAPQKQAADLPKSPSVLPEWNGIVKALKISSLTRELANNCVLKTVDNKLCVLLLEPDFAYLKTARRMETLKKALQDYFGQALKLTIEIKAASENDLHTPAVQAVQQRVATQQAAEKAIAEDENVAALKENFDARVVPGSIDPVE